MNVFLYHSFDLIMSSQILPSSLLTLGWQIGVINLTLGNLAGYESGNSTSTLKLPPQYGVPQGPCISRFQCRMDSISLTQQLPLLLESQVANLISLCILFITVVYNSRIDPPLKACIIVGPYDVIVPSVYYCCNCISMSHNQVTHLSEQYARLKSEDDNIQGMALVDDKGNTIFEQNVPRSTVTRNIMTICADMFPKGDAVTVVLEGTCKTLSITEKQGNYVMSLLKTT